jgi:hypothetical protein
MDTKREKVNKGKNQNSASVSEEESGRTQPEKIGGLRKFLNWISKGAAKSKTGTTGCPT